MEDEQVLNRQRDPGSNRNFHFVRLIVVGQPKFYRP